MPLRSQKRRKEACLSAPVHISDGGGLVGPSTSRSARRRIIGRRINGRCARALFAHVPRACPRSPACHAKCCGCLTKQSSRSQPMCSRSAQPMCSRSARPGDRPRRQTRHRRRDPETDPGDRPAIHRRRDPETDPGRSDRPAIGGATRGQTRHNNSKLELSCCGG